MHKSRNGSKLNKSHTKIRSVGIFRFDCIMLMASLGIVTRLRKTPDKNSL